MRHTIVTVLRGLVLCVLVAIVYAFVASTQPGVLEAVSKALSAMP